MKHTMYYMPSIPEMPKQLFAEIKSAVKTMALTHQIEAELADGRPIEAILASHLPSQDAEKNHADAELIEKGIYDVYGSLNDQKDEEWTAQQINMGMNGLQEGSPAARSWIWRLAAASTPWMNTPTRRSAPSW